MECIGVEVAPKACRDSENVSDAVSTHKAIKAIAFPCTPIEELKDYDKGDFIDKEEDKEFNED